MTAVGRVRTAVAQGVPLPAALAEGADGGAGPLGAGGLLRLDAEVRAHLRGAGEPSRCWRIRA